MTGHLGRVLVVDDSETIRHLIRVNLELEGFLVDTASDGEEALARLAASPDLPDVVTVDGRMPRLDGVGTVESLRADPRTRALKIVMVTANAQDDDRARGYAAGVDAFLTKPFDPAALIALVRGLVRRR